MRLNFFKVYKGILLYGVLFFQAVKWISRRKSFLKDVELGGMEEKNERIFDDVSKLNDEFSWNLICARNEKNKCDLKMIL